MYVRIRSYISGLDKISGFVKHVSYHKNAIL